MCDFKRATSCVLTIGSKLHTGATKLRATGPSAAHTATQACAGLLLTGPSPVYGGHGYKRLKKPVCRPPHCRLITVKASPDAWTRTVRISRAGSGLR